MIKDGSVDLSTLDQTFDTLIKIFISKNTFLLFNSLPSPFETILRNMKIIWYGIKHQKADEIVNVLGG